MANKVVSMQLAGHRKAFGNLRSANERSILAAWRYGQVVDALHSSGFTYEELGEDVDRSKYTVQLYATLFRKYDNEKDLLETAERMKTWNVSRLAGKNALVPAHYQFRCTNCGSSDVKRTKVAEEGEHSHADVVTAAPFKSASNS